MKRRSRAAIPKNLYGTSITEYVVPVGVKQLHNCCFWNCKHLRRLTLNNGIRCIGRSAMCGCTSLTEIAIPDSVEVIEKEAFSESAIETITFPLFPIRYVDRFLFTSSGTPFGPPLQTLKTLRLRTTYASVPSIPFPKITDRDIGQLVGFIVVQQKKYCCSESNIANALFFVCFILKVTRTGLYNAYGSYVLARIFRFWFRGASRSFPVVVANYRTRERARREYEKRFPPLPSMP